MVRDLYSNLGLAQIITPQVITIGGGAVAVADIDLRGFASAMIEAAFGASGDTLAAGVKFDVKLEHADDDGTGSAGAYAEVELTDVVGLTAITGGIIVTVDDPAEDSQNYGVSYIGSKRFIKVTVTPSAGNTNGTPIAVNVIKGDAQQRPVNQPRAV